MSPPHPHSKTHVTLSSGPNPNSWVQVPRSSMEAMAQLLGESPAAGKLLMRMIANMGPGNAVVASQRALADLTGLSESSIKRAMSLLQERRWVSLIQLGPTKTVRAIVVNDKAAWHGPREGLRFSLFSATVLGVSTEQEDMKALETGDLIEIPAIYRSETQMPSGPGLPPPSEPSLPGLEVDLPTRSTDNLPAPGVSDTPAPVTPTAKRRRRS